MGYKWPLALPVYLLIPSPEVRRKQAGPGALTSFLRFLAGEQEGK
jgi:hypothetical protein